MKEKVIFTRWVAHELIKQGFPVLRVEKNPNKPEFNVYVFEESPEFLAAFLNTANRSR